MSASTQQLTDEIANTRQDLAADVDALHDKVSPAAIVDRRKEAAKERIGGLKSSVMGAADSAKPSTSVSDRVQGSPLAAGLVAFGAGMVLSALLPATRAETRGGAALVDTAAQKAQPYVDEARSAARDVGQGLVDQAKSSAQDLAEQAMSTASDLADQAKSSAEDLKSSAEEGVAEAKDRTVGAGGGSSAP